MGFEIIPDRVRCEGTRATVCWFSTLVAVLHRCYSVDALANTLMVNHNDILQLKVEQLV